MDKLRTKKRGFFAISNSLSSSSDKKRNKGEKQEFAYLKGDKPEFTYLKGDKPELDKVELSNAFGNNGTLDEGTDDEIGQGEASGQSSSDLETAVSGSSCDDVHRASRKLQTFAKKSTRRDKKKEKEKQERKEKNKLSMDDFLSKQVEFTTWLEEEKHKNPKEMSSPKRKAYFKTFLKLWNKRKLSQKYYRGSAEIQSPCPANPTRTFSFADDDEEVVSFSRPKSKRLSIEPWGPPDSPFSTFGKTPPKHLQGTNLALLDSGSSLMESSLKEDNHEISGSYKHDSLPKLGEYQIPKNALPMTDAEQTVITTENSNAESQQFPAPELPGTPASSISEKSPVYAVPWKPKPTPRKKPPEVTQVVKSPSPPPVPPKSYKIGDHKEVIQPAPHDQAVSQTKGVLQPGDIQNHDQEAVVRRSISESCSSMEVDDCSPSEQGIQREDGWHSPIKEKPFSPPIKILKTFFPQEQIYAEIESVDMKPAEDKEITEDLVSVDDDHVFTESVSELHTDVSFPQSDSSAVSSSPESKVKHVVLENLLTTRESRFSFSKYLITPDKYAAAPVKHSSLSKSGKENVASKKCLEQENEFSSLDKGGTSKEKPKIPPRNIPKLRSEFKVTMRVSSGLHNVRNFLIVDNKPSKPKENKDNRKVDPTQGETQKSRNHSEGEHHHAITESRSGRSEKLAVSLDISRNPNTKQQEKFLETDIDSMPLPIMGCKTPPLRRKPLSNLQRSKSLETIIW